MKGFGRGYRDRYRLRILSLLGACILLAGALFLADSADEGTLSGTKTAEAEEAGTNEEGTGRAGTSGATKTDSGGMEGIENKPAESGGASFEDVMRQNSDALEPIQRIGFFAGTEHALQRSVPVRISAYGLGGEPEETCWALFLPAEMSARPKLFFSAYTEVSMESLGDPGSGGTVSGAGEKTYHSGEEVTGLSNGNVVRVRMRSPDGSLLETDLYVFSCDGTATMYLDTESGSMENVDADPGAGTSEKMSWIVIRPDGNTDAEGTGIISGRGNSTWERAKKPYNLNLSEERSILDMKACRKLCLLANSFDETNLLDRVSSQIALKLGMRDTPEGEFVNLYLNGQYNGLYYLSQRVRTGGSVHIEKLDKEILGANGLDQEPEVLPKRIALHEKGERLKKWAFDWSGEPRNNTGGYLLEQRERYDGDDAWFSTNHRRLRVISPSYPTPGEVTWLQDYMIAAERAVYSEDGIDRETGKSYADYLDVSSWEDMLLLEEYFCEWDGERWSFFITKDRDDPLLYCGPKWDFDHSAGVMLQGTYPGTAVTTLVFRDNRHGWFHTLLSHGEFTDALHERWTERFSPAVRDYLETRMEKEITAIESAAVMNNVRRANDPQFREKAEALRTWLLRRADFLDGYCADPGAYCRVEWRFPWGILSNYYLPGTSPGFLPLEEYGETQTPSQKEKHEIIGWKDEEGQEISADFVVDRDRVFSAICR